MRPADFKEHIKYLLENNYRFVSLYDIINNFEAKTVALTFDDGYKNNYLNAHSVLTEFKIPATIFIVAGLIGQKSLWDEKDGWPSDELLSWPEIKEMARNSINIGSHSLNHTRLTKEKLWPKIWAEIKFSKKVIEKEISHEVLFFSYPFGRSNFLIQQMVKWAGYSSACGNSLPDNQSVNLYNLPRIEVATADSPLDKFSNLIERYAF